MAKHSEIPSASVRADVLRAVEGIIGTSSGLNPGQRATVSEVLLDGSQYTVTVSRVREKLTKVVEDANVQPARD